MRGRWGLVLALLAGSAAAGAQGGGAGAAAHTRVDFSYVPRLANESAWKISVGPDGAGTYQEGTAAAVPLRISGAVWTRLEAGSAAVEAHSCETRQKNIAQTGKKTVEYAQGGAGAECSFNYSDDDGLNDTAKAFEGLAATMQYGARLRRERRFDHLGLAAEMDALMVAVKDGRALEVGNIASVLQGLVDDEEVIGVVRRHAKELLETVNARAAS